MFNDNYVCEAKGIPLVSYYREIKDVEGAHVFTTMHYHSDFEILYITNGRAKMILNGNAFYAEAGNMILINPYEVHYGEVLTPNFSYYCLDFDLKMLSLPCEEKIFAEEIKYLNHVKDGNFEPYIHEICTCYTDTPAGWQLRAKGELLVLFSFLEEKLVATGPSKETEFSKRIINFVRDNFMKNISSGDAAAELSYNQSYFCRVFKKNFSHTFSEYLNLYRIKRAKELLRTEKVSDTAMLCGFSSISYFSIEFKRRCGMSPMEYKMRIRQSTIGE